ncbi:MAG: hypothetical protein JNK76_02620 [Planctomycetales bacterium]|nr:hypothetical protein [Planctomycetales bacterium]
MRNQGFQAGFHGISTCDAAAQIRRRRGAPSGAARYEFGGRTKRPTTGCAEPTDCAARRTVAPLHPTDGCRPTTAAGNRDDRAADADVPRADG